MPRKPKPIIGARAIARHMGMGTSMVIDLLHHHDFPGCQLSGGQKGWITNASLSDGRYGLWPIWVMEGTSKVKVRDFYVLILPTRSPEIRIFAFLMFQTEFKSKRIVIFTAYGEHTEQFFK